MFLLPQRVNNHQQVSLNDYSGGCDGTVVCVGLLINVGKIDEDANELKSHGDTSQEKPRSHELRTTLGMKKIALSNNQTEKILLNF